MSQKQMFGGVLTTLGILSLLTGAYFFVSGSNSGQWKAITTAVVLGIIFFGAGIGLIKNTD